MAEETGEKLYTIPLRKAFNKPKFSRADVAVRIIKNYVKTHLKVNDVKIGKHLNHTIWENGKVNIPRKVRVSVSKENNTGYTELAGFEFEKMTVDEVKAGGMKEKLMDRLGGKAMQKQAEEELIEEGKAPTKEAVEKEVEEELKESAGKGKTEEEKKPKDIEETEKSSEKKEKKESKEKKKSDKANENRPNSDEDTKNKEK